LKALERFCKTDAGFSGIRDVGSDSPVKDDKMESFFLAETLKYFYLLFSPIEYMSLDRYVFTTEAHPLKIIPELRF
jgi:mannosyl-oligosaccharide alpha-1,2-mannosidase